jgi:hypothetical protein
MSLRMLFLVIACVALDCGVFRFALFNPKWGGGLGFVGAIGFANVLALAAARLAAQPRRSPARVRGVWHRGACAFCRVLPVRAPVLVASGRRIRRGHLGRCPSLSRTRGSCR